ncbi:DNA alkylation repair protein [Xylanibacter caecicola]|uniref:DNA alkylation repair protein n=1 Tax=Xylanibacter caecicola TaxID=2736294 RepID=UPI00258E4334|nr:DNA alkylation repair protein [Xylanibacter caecicola]
MKTFSDILTTADEVAATMEALGDEEQRNILKRFFKTGKGEYGEGDDFLGIKVPVTRSVALAAAGLPHGETEKLLASPKHEIRLCGFLILVEQFRKISGKRAASDPDCMKTREEAVNFYLQHARCANNWDLVDLSAPKIIGQWLVMPSTSSEEHKRETLDRLATSSNLWEQRIAIVSTMTPIRNGDFRHVLRYAERLLTHRHDLIHKAVGWMLREVGKKDIGVLRAFLKQHLKSMPRTTLRYAIERMDDVERKYWMKPADNQNDTF